jgi:hypothetical protein
MAVPELTDQIVHQLRNAVGDAGEMVVVNYPTIQSIWSRAGGIFDTAEQLYLQYLSRFWLDRDKDRYERYVKQAEAAAATRGYIQSGGMARWVQMLEESNDEDCTP